MQTVQCGSDATEFYAASASRCALQLQSSKLRLVNLIREICTHSYSTEDYLTIVTLVRVLQ